MPADILSGLILGPLELLFGAVFAAGYRFTGNPGLSILLLSAAVTLLLRPLYRRAEAVQEEERLTALRLKPGVEKIRRAFRGDERFMILQTYYRQNGYKPYYTLKGSLSLLLQIPFFLAAYRCLSGLSLLQGASFGPVADLGKPDGLIALGSVSVNLLPLLMTLFNVLSGALYTRGRSLRSRIQLYAMALVFLVLLYGSPSGLVLYWTLNNAFSLLRNILRRKAPDPGKAGPAPSETPRHAAAVFFLSCALLSILLGVMLPSAVVKASPGEFVEAEDFHSPLRYVAASALTAAGTFLLWGAVLFFLSSPRGRKRLACGAAALAACAAVDCMFFGGGYGNLSSLLKYDDLLSVRAGDCLLNLGALGAAAAAAVWAWKRKPEVLKAACVAGCLALAFLSFQNVRGIRAETADLKAAAEEERIRPSFTLSRAGRNVAVIMLDRCISGFLPYILEENPVLAEQLRGFTWYPNTLSFGRNTNVCTPSLYGGYEYRPFELDRRSDTGLPEKQNEALKVMPVLFSENGFETTVCDPPYAGYLWIPDLGIYDDYPAVRRFNTNGAFMDRTEAIRRKDRTIRRNMFCYSLFRASPVLLQPAVYDEGRYHEPEALAPEPETGFTAESPLKGAGLSDDFMKAYTALQNLTAMTEISGGGEDTFLILSNTATHDVTLLQEPAFGPAPSVDNTAYEAGHRVRGAYFGRPMELRTLA